MADFADIIDQNQMKEHMQHALSTGKVSHAYIISGENSSGKEYIAKIFAKALQCQHKENKNEYIEASVSINCSKFRIIMDHLIPNCMSPMIVQATMGVAQTITTASGLSFIGLGVQPPIPEWGAMLSGARQFIRQAPHLVIFPGLAIAVVWPCPVASLFPAVQGGVGGRI